MKTSNELHYVKTERQKAAHKRALWADVVCADEVLLATTQGAWAPSSVDAMKDEMGAFAWMPGHHPRLVLLTGLGAKSEQRIEVDW